MNLIFDFDGTIVDSLPLAVEIVNKYLSKYPWLFGNHKSVTAEQIRGKGTKKLLVEFNVKGWKLYFLVLLARVEINKLRDRVKIFPGISRILAKLAKNNKLYIVTSNSKNHAQYVLNKNGIAKYFEEVDSSISYFGKSKKLLKLMKKCNLDPKETIYVGDETRDIEAAKKAGIRAVAVTWGFEDRALLAGAKPDKIISKTCDLSV